MVGSTRQADPLLVGGIVCVLGAIACAMAPSIWFLVAARAIHGLGGGIAAAVARAAIVDVARGPVLAKVLSLLQALGGVAPMIAPIAGALVITVAGWREVFWVLAGMGALMLLTALWFVPETLAREHRHSGGLRTSLSGVGLVMRVRPFVGYMLVGAFSGFTMMAYIANAAYILQGMKGMSPLAYSLFFASTALAQVVLAVVNARIVGRISARTLIRIGLGASTIAVTGLALGVLLWHTPLVLTCIGFLIVMASQAFIYGNAGALAALQVTHIAGAAAAIQGVAGALAMAVAAPLASAGGTQTAVPMILVMVAGTMLAWASFTLAGHRSTSRGPSGGEPAHEQAAAMK